MNAKTIWSKVVGEQDVYMVLRYHFTGDLLIAKEKNTPL